MIVNAHSKEILPSKAPILLLVSGLLFAVLAATLSPALFIELGPMRQSLLSEIDFVRHVAHLEIWVARILFGLIGLGAVLCWAFWGHLHQSAWAARLSQHRPLVPNRAVLSARTFWYIAGVVLVALIWIGASAGQPALMPAAIAQEDGLIEYLTAVLFLIAAFWSFQIACTAPTWPRRIVHAVLAVGFVLCVGEELSWGQRIFDFSTPEVVKQINAQSEFNIHNSLGYAADHIFILGIFVCGFILPLLAHRVAFLRNLFDRMGLPVASIGLALGFALISGLHDWTVYKVIPATPLRIAELRELLSALALLLLMLEVRDAVRGSQGRVRAQAPDSAPHLFTSTASSRSSS